MRFFLFFLFSFSLLLGQNKYFNNHACSECHEKIYQEYQSSAHSKSYFTDELHRKIADKVSKKEYECAICHMPMANNLKDLVTGKARPDKNNKTHTDAISCYFCHTIAYVKKSHKYNINTKSRQAQNFKPTLYGRLENPDDSDKHSSVKNPIYGKMACMGCHSHKLNENNVTIFRAMSDKQDSQKCIECHMPEIAGGAEKMDKKARGHHASHKFLGIHDKKFRAKGVDINISYSKDKIDIILTNKMGHPLIIQPARVKYLEVKVIRNNKEIWKNYKKEPNEDKKAFFELKFKDKNGKKIIIPAHAYSTNPNNLLAHKSKKLEYKVNLQKYDKIEVTLFVRLAKKDCQKVIKLKDKKFKKPFIIKKVLTIVK
jgi:hypothetical protein